MRQTARKSCQEGSKLQSATGQTKRPGNTGSATPIRRPVRKRLLPITKIIAALITLLAIGGMLFVLLGYWPPKESQEASPTLGPTPAAILKSGLTVEKAGPIKSDPNSQNSNQILIPVKVTNKVEKSAKLHITPTPGVVAPTPTAAPATVLNADIRVIFYKRDGDTRKIVGVAYGNATNIKYGESKTVEIVGTGIANPQDLEYDVLIDSMWTDKDAQVTRNGAAIGRAHIAYFHRNP